MKRTFQGNGTNYQALYYYKLPRRADSPTGFSGGSYRDNLLVRGIDLLTLSCSARALEPAVNLGHSRLVNWSRKSGIIMICNFKQPRMKLVN